MKKLLLLIYLVSFSTFGQERKIKTLTYLDENMNEIDSLTYKKKCKSSVLKCLEYEKDSLFKIYKVLYKYSFGKISITETKQLKNLLAFNGNTFNSQSNIIVNYKDSLYDYKAQKRRSDRHRKTHVGVPHKILTHKAFDDSRKKWIKSQKKCIRKIKAKYNTETFYIYKYDYGSIKDYPDLGWIKDRGSFKNIFFSIMYNSNLLILKPNGEYFLSGEHLSNKTLKKLLNNDWSQFKKDLNDSYNSDNNEAYGLFNTYSSCHIPHCF